MFYTSESFIILLLLLLLQYTTSKSFKIAPKRTPAAVDGSRDDESEEIFADDFRGKCHAISDGCLNCYVNLPTINNGPRVRACFEGKRLTAKILGGSGKRGAELASDRSTVTDLATFLKDGLTVQLVDVVEQIISGSRSSALLNEIRHVKASLKITGTLLPQFDKRRQLGHNAELCATYLFGSVASSSKIGEPKFYNIGCSILNIAADGQPQALAAARAPDNNNFVGKFMDAPVSAVRSVSRYFIRQ